MLMPRFIKRRSRKTGLPPGSLVHIGEEKTERVGIRLVDYDGKQLQEKDLETIEECFPFKGEPTVSWVNVDGVHDVEMIGKLGKQFGVHPLVLEDVVNTAHRPKVEDFGNYLFIVIKMLHYDEKQEHVQSEQLSLILGRDFLISFQESQGDHFNSVRERIRKSKGRIRNAGSDYLAYALIDAVVDHYFSILELFAEKMQALEEELISEPRSETMEMIHHMKREMIYVRKQVWPMREVANGLTRGEFDLIEDSTVIYLQDVHDHTIQVIDTLESLRDMLSGMLDIYLSTMSNKMNEVMKLLTIMASIFIPLTFIAGIYGMNFKYMPELEWQWGYFAVWAVMVVVVVSMLILFKKKNWL
jgi:magnesium transporter